MSEERDDPKTSATKVYLSDAARAMLDDLCRLYFPGRPRVQSQTVEKLIRDRYALEKAKREQEQRPKE